MSGFWVHRMPDIGQVWIESLVNCQGCGSTYRAVYPDDLEPAFPCPCCEDRSVWTYQPFPIEA